MELQTYLAIVWRRKWIILVTTLVCLIGVAIATYFATPIYVSSTTLRGATVGADPISRARPDIEYTLRLMNTYANIVNSRSTSSELMSRLHLNQYPTLSVAIIPSTDQIG